MKLWKRKTLLISAFILFFVISPILVFYAIGYRYDFENKAFRKIGMIIVESEPKNADIFIDNKYKSKTPFRIKNLLPDEYSIEVVKNGFTAWKKNLLVESKKVTWASNIVLFYEKPETNKLSEISFNKFNISPNYKKIIASSNHNDNSGIWLVDIESNLSKKLFPKEGDDNQTSPIPNKNYINLKYSSFKWSPDSKKIIFSIKDNKLEETVIVDTTEDTKPIYINSSYDLKTEDIQWKNNEEIYLLDKSGNIHQIELNLEYAPKRMLENVTNFKFNKKNNKIIYISKENNEYKLASIKEEIKNNILNLPKDENFEIEEGKYNTLALLLKNKKELILINTETNEPRVIGRNINSFSWSKKKNKLLYFSNNELWFYPLEDKNDGEIIISPTYKYNEPNLLTRYSTEIKNAIWYPNEEYVAVLLENNAKIIELDSRGNKNCQEYKNDLLIKDHFIEFNKNGESIYLINKENALQDVKITEL